LYILGAFLENNGFETEVVHDGLPAMECISKRRPDLITLDITMPEQSGVKTYRQLKKR